MWNGGKPFEATRSVMGQKRAGGSPRGNAVAISKEGKRVLTRVPEARFFRVDSRDCPPFHTQASPGGHETNLEMPK
jgi:hypothetical protein